MLESPLIQHFIQQAETRTETRVKQETILKLLQHRFDSVPESVTEQIISIQSLARLDSLFEEVLNAQNLNEVDLENPNSQ